MDTQVQERPAAKVGPNSRRASVATHRPRPGSRRWPLALAAVGLLAGIGWWATHHGASPAAQATAAAEVATVTRGTVERSVSSSGKVVSNLDVDIKARTGGEVTKLLFDISQTVKKGDLVCQLDPTDAQLAVRSAEAMVGQATAKLGQAKNDLATAEQNLVTTRRKDEATLASAKVKATNLRAKADRQKQLVQQKLGSREEMESAETDATAAENEFQSAQIAIDDLKQLEIQIEYKRAAVKVAEAQLQSDQITLDTQRQQLAYTTVSAPVDGVVSALNVQKGTIVASGVSGFSGGTTIMTLSDLSRVFVTATVDESDIGGVRVGQKARVSLTSFPDVSFAGEVVRLTVTGVNTSNVVTFEVKVEVTDERKGQLRPQMTGNVTILQDERQGVLTLPASAVTRDGDHAYVTTADGQRREVKLGVSGYETVEVVSGLAEGEKVRVAAAELPTRWKSNSSGPPQP